MQSTLFSRSSVTTKLPTYKPQAIPLQEEESEAYRQLCVKAVFSVWNTEHRASDLAEIYYYVHSRVNEMIANGEWPYAQFVRSKRTVDRRVNEIASKDFNKDGIVKVVAVTAGIYQPSPKLFEGSK